MFLREYFPSDTIKLINQSEGRAGVSGKAAHALSRHLLARSPGAVLYNHTTAKIGGIGVGGEAFRDRFKNASPQASGDMPVNSGWIGKGGMGMQLAETSITPATVQEVLVNTLNPKTGAQITYTQKNRIPEQRSGNVKAANIASVAAVLDNVGGVLHLQTFYPAHYAVESHASWTLGMVSMVATINPAGNAIVRTMPPRGDDN